MPAFVSNKGCKIARMSFAANYQVPAFDFLALPTSPHWKL